MGIPQNHFEVGVSHQVADGVEIDTRLHEAARKMMPQVVEAEILQVRALDELSPGGINAGELGSRSTPKDVGIIAHPARLLLPAADGRQRFDV